MANTPKKDIGPIWPTSLVCFADHIPIRPLMKLPR
jgi:hypothetical protein